MEKKHFTSKEVPSKFSHKHWSSNTFWIVFVSVLFFLFLVFSKWNKIEEFFGFSVDRTVVNEEFVMWEEVSVEGILTQDWDFITHTHKLSTLSSGVFWLKSKSINLNQYSGTVLLEGFVDNKHQWLYILDVTKIMSQFDDNPLDENLATWTVLWQYFPDVWIYFKSEFFEKYEIVSTWKTNIQIKSFNSDSLIKIDYFLCKKWNSNTDCGQLSKTFSDSSEKRFTKEYWTIFYKLAEVTSWFFTNKEFFWYFINDVPEEEVTKLSSYIILPTIEYVENVLEPRVGAICKEWNVVMNNVKKSTLFLDQSKLAVNFMGDRENWTAECIIKIDPSLPNLWVLKTFVYEDGILTGDVESQETIESIEDSETTPEIVKPLPNQSASDVPQYALNLEKPLVFTSSRGHSISFPSPKISYKSDSVSENLGLAGVNCYVATKVVEYEKRDLIDSEPSVVVYECKIKEGVDLPYEYYENPVSDGRNFVVSVINPAWHDFANNIQVTLN